MASAENHSSSKRNGGLRRRNSRVVSAINLTSLIDVMLVLLIIFMIASPMLISGVEVELPKTKMAPISGNDEPLVVSVNRQGNIYLQEELIAPDALNAKLRAVMLENKDLRVFIKGDKNIDYGTVMNLFGAIKQAGIKHVSLITDPND